MGFDGRMAGLLRIVREIRWLCARLGWGILVSVVVWGGGWGCGILLGDAEEGFDRASAVGGKAEKG